MDRSAIDGANLDPNPLLYAEGVAKSFNGVPALLNGALKLRTSTVNALCGRNGVDGCAIAIVPAAGTSAR